MSCSAHNSILRLSKFPALRRAAWAAALLLTSVGIVRADAPAAPATQGDSGQEDLSKLSLEELMAVPVVVAAGKREQTQNQVAASVSVVTDNDIDLMGYRSMADVLRNQRSFYLYTDGMNWMAGTRGFLRAGEWNARLLMLVDGRPTRENVYGETDLDPEFVVPMDAIKRVEIVRGPGSALYGNNAVFGVLNVVTKDGRDVNGVLVRGAGGTEDTGRGSIIVGGETKSGWDIIGGVSGSTSQGANDIIYDGIHDAAHNFGHVRNSDYEGAAAAFVKVRKGEFTATFDYETRDHDNRGATYDTSFFNPGAEHEERGNVTLRFDHPVAEGQSLHAMVYYSHFGYRETENYLTDPTTVSPSYWYIAKAGDDWLGEEVHYDWQLNPKLHLLAGADGTQSFYDHQNDFSQPSGTVVNASDSYNAWGLFAEVEFKPFSWLTLVGGVREDDVQRIGFHFSPRAAIIVNPDKDDTFKVMYGRAFRAPNLLELFYSSPGYWSPNPNLKSEIVDTYEVTWDRQLGHGWQATAGTFFWSMAHSMDPVNLPNGAIQIQNAGTDTAQGIEAELDRRWDNGGLLRIHGTVVHTNEDDGSRLTLSPEWVVGAAVVVPVYKNIYFSIEPQVVGQMKNDSGKYTSPTFVTNAVLTVRDVAGVRNLEMQVGAYNLFSNAARFPSGNSANNIQPTLNWPRPTVMAGLSYKF